MEERRCESNTPAPDGSVTPNAALWGALLALAVLAAGALVYTLDRPAGSAAGLPWPLAPTGRNLGVFGVLGGSLPSFAHAFAFSLANCLLLSGAGVGYAALGGCCGRWALLETVLECLQHPALGQPLATLLRQVVPHGATPDTWADRLVGHVANYFAHGTFDPLDVIAALVGAGASFTLAAWWLWRSDADPRRLVNGQRAPEGRLP